MGQRPGGAFGVGHGGTGGEAVAGECGGDGGEHCRFAAEQMGAAGGVEEKAVIRGADDRREALGPAGERVAEGGEALGLLGPGDQGGADGAGVRQAEAGGEAQSRRRRVDRDQPQCAALLSNDGEGAGEAGLAVAPELGFGGKVGQGDGDDTAGHGDSRGFGILFLFCSIFFRCQLPTANSLPFCRPDSG